MIVRFRNYINTWIEKFHNDIFLIVNFKYTKINYFIETNIYSNICSHFSSENIFQLYFISLNNFLQTHSTYISFIWMSNLYHLVLNWHFKGWVQIHLWRYFWVHSSWAVLLIFWNVRWPVWGKWKKISVTHDYLL